MSNRVVWLRAPTFRAVILDTEEPRLIVVRGNYSVGDVLDISGAEAVIVGEYPARAAKAKGESIIRNARKVDYDYSRAVAVIKELVASPTIEQMRNAEDYTDGFFFLRREGDVRELQFAFAVPSVNNAAENNEQLWGIDVMFSKRRFGDSRERVEAMTSGPYYVYGFLKDLRLHAVTVVPTVNLDELGEFKTAKELMEEGAKNEPDKEGS